VTQVSLLHISEHVLLKFHSNDDVFNANYMSSTSEAKTAPSTLSSFSTATRRVGRPTFLSSRGAGAVGDSYFYSPQHPDWLCCSSDLLFNGYEKFLLKASSGRDVNLTIHFNLVLWLKINGVIPPLPHTFPRRGTALKQ